MAAAKNKKKKAPQKTPQKKPLKAALTWEELLVEKALAMISETGRQINESAERFEQQRREKDRQVNESAERYEHQIKETVEKNKWEMTEITGETDRETKESYGRTGQKIKGSAEKPGKKMKNADGRLDRPSKSSEDSGYIDLPNLMRKFRELGFVFEKSYKEAVISDKKNNISIEIDITLESSDKVMIVKTKTRPSDKDITGHTEQMKKMRQYGDLHGEKRKYLGAIYGIDFNDSEKLFTIKNGFYVIEPSGKTFVITAPEGIYFPKEW